jgi:hypothetical protein
VAALVVVGCAEGRSALAERGRLIAWRGRSGAWAFVVLVPPVLLPVAGPAAALVSGGRLSAVVAICSWELRKHRCRVDEPGGGAPAPWSAQADSGRW